MMEKNITYGKLASEFALSPQEVAVKVPSKKDRLFIGMPKELSFQENRVALTPESVALLVNNGHQVYIETNAGLTSSFDDRQYSEVGARIVYDVEEIFEASIIMKVAPPSKEELEMIKPYQTIFSTIHLPTLQSAYIETLMNKKATAVAYEYIKDESGAFPVVRAVSEIAGSTAVLIASEYLTNLRDGQGILLGGISGVPPAKIVILGAGVVGEFATRTALGLGAEVRVFDNNIYKLMRLQNNVNVRVYTSTINPEHLNKELAEADVVVGAIHSESGRTPCIVTEEMVASMKPGSVIIDVSIDQGGCFETSRITSHTKPVFKKYDVIHYCVPNIASRVSKTASYAFSHVLTPILLEAHWFGGFEKMLLNSPGTRNGVYIYKGCLTNQHLSERFDLKYTNLDLLMTASY